MIKLIKNVVVNESALRTGAVAPNYPPLLTISAPLILPMLITAPLLIRTFVVTCSTRCNHVYWYNDMPSCECLSTRRVTTFYGVCCAGMPVSHLCYILDSIHNCVTCPCNAPSFLTPRPDPFFHPLESTPPRSQGPRLTSGLIALTSVFPTLV